MANLQERLLLRVERVPFGGCWLWTGCVNEDGYGLINVGPKEYKRTHRLSYELFVGAPSDLHVLHKCDVPCCVNPDHLFLGTHRDNMIDKAKKGRVNYGGHIGASGEAHHGAKLTVDQVLKIRERLASGERNCDLADEYHVVRSVITNIKNRRRWRHV